MKKYAYGWLTCLFFLVSMAGHWVFGWFAYVDEAIQHGQQASVAEFAVQIARDTFENWQSEFLQLIWQVVGLAYFLYVGSPASKENDDRLEAKVDALLKLSGKDGEAIIAELDQRYLRVDGHAKPHGHADL
nr:DUF6766 family protein [Sphingomonas sp. Y57]